MENWENLRFYLAVARNGTVLGASRELGVSHATVLRRIDQLEGEIGQKLFNRLQSGYVLTEQGHLIREMAQRVEQNVNQLTSSLNGANDGAGVLRVAKPESDPLNLFPLFAQFCEAYPNITLELHSSDSFSNLNQLEVDVAIRVTETPSELLVGRELGVVTYRLYGDREYLQRFAPRDFGNYAWVLWQGIKQNLQLEWLEEQSITPRVALYTSRWLDMVQAINAGTGVGFLPVHTARLHPNLVEIPIDIVQPRFPVWILMHRDLRSTERVQKFVRFISDRVGAQRAVLSPEADALSA